MIYETSRIIQRIMHLSVDLHRTKALDRLTKGRLRIQVKNRIIPRSSSHCYSLRISSEYSVGSVLLLFESSLGYPSHGDHQG